MNSATQVRFELSPKQTEAYKYLHDDVSTEIFFGGGAGSGKSYFACYWHIERRIKYAGTRGLIARETLKTVNESTMVTFYDLCSKLKLYPGIHFTHNRVMNELVWFNGSKTIVKELKYYPSDPDYHHLGSIEYTDVIIEECPEIDEKAFDMINTRIRYKLKEHNLIPKTLLTGNAGDSWVKKKYVCNDEGEIIQLLPFQKIVLATASDNPDKDFQKLYLSQLNKTKNEYDRQRLMYGDWLAKPKTGKEYYFNFNRQKHVDDIKYNPRLPLHLTFDMNVNPYMTLVVAQIDTSKNGYVNVNIIDEFCLKHPFNKTKSVCEAFMRKYEKHKEGVFYYGDATSHRNNTMTTDEIRHDYDIIDATLWKYLSRTSCRVPRSNPPVIKRRDFILDVLDEKTILRLRISENCRETIKDFMHLLEGADGKKFKEKARDQATNTLYEKYGHTSDAVEYFLCEAFASIFNLYAKAA